MFKWENANLNQNSLSSKLTHYLIAKTELNTNQNQHNKIETEGKKLKIKNSFKKSSKETKLRLKFRKIWTAY